MQTAQPPSDNGENIYLMGYSAEEYARLMRQAQLFNGATDYLFRQAGLQPGMKVLDLGCGVGDASLVARAIVGDAGAVTAVDRDPQALALAQQRAQAQGYENISLIQANIDTGDFGTTATFDAVVSRFFFMYITDADLPRVLTQIKQRLKPNGILALHELDLKHTMEPMGSNFANLHQCWQLLYQQLGINPQMSFRMYRALQQHGFTMIGFMLLEQLGSGADFAAYQYYEDLFLGALPLFEQFGIAQRDHLQDIAKRLRTEALATDAILALKKNGLVWGRNPA